MQVLDYGPAPFPSRFPVKLLVATQSEDIMDTVLDQLLDHSAERPVKIVATADVLELNNLITHIRVRLCSLFLFWSSGAGAPGLRLVMPWNPWKQAPGFAAFGMACTDDHVLPLPCAAEGRKHAAV